MEDFKFGIRGFGDKEFLYENRNVGFIVSGGDGQIDIDGQDRGIFFSFDLLGFVY